MNFYNYWYLIVYDLYKKFSRDKHFDIFATGLFSVFVGFFVAGFFGILFYYINSINLVLNEWTAVCIGVFVLIANYIFFNRKRQNQLYKVFKECRSIRKDILSVTMTLISIILFVVAVRINM